MLELVQQNLPAIRELCQRYGVGRLILFGSAAVGGREPPDLDFFYEMRGGVEGLFDRFFGFKEELEALLGRPVDLVSLKDVTNPYFLNAARRHEIELYAA